MYIWIYDCICWYQHKIIHIMSQLDKFNRKPSRIILLCLDLWCWFTTPPGEYVGFFQNTTGQSDYTSNPLANRLFIFWDWGMPRVLFQEYVETWLDCHVAWLEDASLLSTECTFIAKRELACSVEDWSGNVWSVLSFASLSHFLNLDRIGTFNA